MNGHGNIEIGVFLTCRRTVVFVVGLRATQNCVNYHNSNLAYFYLMYSITYDLISCLKRAHAQ